MSRVILEDIINHFEPGKFTRFFREKNSKFTPREESYREYDEENFVNGNKLGEISFDETEQVAVVTFEVKQPLSERSGKRAQYEKGKRILKEKQYDAGIFIFYDTQGNFRFSLIYANYLGRRRDWSAFRRFTYFVSTDPESTNKTFKQRIGDADFSTLEKIKDAFSVEKVTQSFYTDIANWYFWAVQKSKFPNDTAEENGRNIAIIRLVTRLIFIWFMKIKGLIPEMLFAKTEIKSLLNNMNPDETTYYKAILQNLFFATLNSKIKDRKYRFQNPDYSVNKDYMNHSIYRYESFFKDKNVMLEIFKDIPFLNGGLFDCLDKPSKDNNDQGEIRIDGFSDKDVGLKVPNLLFFSDTVEADLNKEYGTSNKKYHVRGLLDILQSYNFTIDENDPNDQEVALDPELLGKVFENLLASFNPETASTARKATGSYYTPREIVDYMVSESLKNYFKTGLEIEGIDDKLTVLFSVENDENPFDTHQTLKLVQMINDLRVVDPAVGSGAFPMGILNKLVFILGKLDPDNTLWKNAQIKAIEAGVTDPMLKKQLADQVEERFTSKNLDYGRKLYLIQKCIYGVDIQQIAVEIAKLRFFISLLVDEKIDKTKENWGVEPLPNLDYKIMQGNSLLEEYEGIKLFDERLLNVTLPDESESKEIEGKIKEIERKLMPFYIKEPRLMKNPKLERPQELVVLESEINRLRLAQKDLIKFNQAKMANGNQAQLQFQAKEGQSQEVWIQLQDLHKKLFTPTLTRDDKREIKKEIDRLEWRLIEATLREQNKTKELEKIEKMENSNTKPFFLWRLYFPEVFEEKGGFDIVIANPPYVSVFSLSRDKVDKKALKDKYESARGAFDLYVPFMELAAQLVIDNGVVCYITPNKYLAAEYSESLRKLIIRKIPLLKILDLSHENVFDAGVYPIVSLFKKTSQLEKVSPFIYVNTSQNGIFQLSHTVDRSLLEIHPYWSFVLFPNHDLMRLTINCLRVDSICKINASFSVSEAYITRSLVLDYQPSKEELSKFIISSNIFKYYIDNREPINYLGKKYSNPIFLLKSPLKETRIQTIKLPKIITAGMTKSLRFFPDLNGEYCSGIPTIYFYEFKQIDDLLCISAFLNSKLCSFIYRLLFDALSLSGGYLRIGKPQLEYLPFIDIEPKKKKLSAKFVKEIISITTKDDYLENSNAQARVNMLTNEIDKIIYETYGISQEEVFLIEQSSL